MLANKKKQYALRAMYELARHYGNGKIKMNHIAKAQSIPERFLEVILVELKNGGFIASKRGFNGGYELLQPPHQLTVGMVMRYLTRDTKPTECMAPIPETKCPFQGQCAFYPMWKSVRDAMFQVFDDTTFQDLLDGEQGIGIYPLGISGQQIGVIP